MARPGPDGSTGEIPCVQVQLFTNINFIQSDISIVVASSWHPDNREPLSLNNRHQDMNGEQQ
jgi:hypothetical protein